MRIVDLVRTAGLTGRGGAAFSTAIKMESALANKARLVVNVCDGEVGAAKDGWVVSHHLAEVVSATRLLSPEPAVFAAHKDSAAAATLTAAGVQVAPVPHRYVSSEESSLVSLVNGGLARPMTKRQPISLGGVDQRGRRFRPTLVLNAETLWRIAQIVERGPQWFRSYGLPDEPGPRLASVQPIGGAPVVVHTAAGVPLADLVTAAGIDHGHGPVNVGGLSGGWLLAEQARHTSWSRASLGAHGLRIGAGIIRVLGSGACPWQEVVAMTRYAAGESAGQCGPCMFGLPSVADELEAVVSGHPGADLARLRHRLGLLPGRGACHHPDGVAGFVASALNTFADDLQAHRLGGCLHTTPTQQGGRRELVSL